MLPAKKGTSVAALLNNNWGHIMTSTQLWQCALMAQPHIPQSHIIPILCKPVLTLPMKAQCQVREQQVYIWQMIGLTRSGSRPLYQCMWSQTMLWLIRPSVHEPGQYLYNRDVYKIARLQAEYRSKLSQVDGLRISMSWGVHLDIDSKNQNTSVERSL